MNALKSGLDAESQFVLGETREEFAQLQSEYYDFLQPATPFERAQLDNCIRNDWYLRRLFRVEAQLWEHHSMQSQRGTGVELAEGYDKHNNSFTRLWRRKKGCEEAQLVAQAELERLVRLRTAAQEPIGAAPVPDSSTSQPQETKAETPQSASFLEHPPCGVASLEHPPCGVASLTSPKTGQLTDQGFDLLCDIFSQKLQKTYLPDPEAAEIDDPEPDKDPK